MIKLTSCNETGKEAGDLWLATGAIQTLRRKEHCTEIVLMGGNLRLVKQTPEEIVKIMES